MKGYCKNCKKKVEGVNKKGYLVGSILISILLMLVSLPLGIIILLISIGCKMLPWNKNRCPICGLKIKFDKIFK